jgi:hypothetical protein
MNALLFAVTVLIFVPFVYDLKQEVQNFEMTSICCAPKYVKLVRMNARNTLRIIIVAMNA